VLAFFWEKFKEANYGGIFAQVSSLHQIVKINVSPSMREIEIIVLGIIFT
jgi:hypothetical protein